MTYNHTQILKKRKWQSYTCSGLERDNSKPRRGSFLNYFWTSSIHAVCFCNCYFNFNLRTQGKLTQYQHHRKKNNWKILHPVDQPLAVLDVKKQHGKVIQQRAGAKYKFLEKGMKTPSSLVIDLLTNIRFKLLLLWENTQRRLSVKSLTKEIISSFPCTSQPRSLHLVHLHKPELFFLSSLGFWVSGV